MLFTANADAVNLYHDKLANKVVLVEMLFEEIDKPSH